MDDEDEIKFKLRTLKEGKKIVIEVTSTSKMSSSDFIMALEHFLQDLIRADRQRSNDPSLH